MSKPKKFYVVARMIPWESVRADGKRMKAGDEQSVGIAIVFTNRRKAEKFAHGADVLIVEEVRKGGETQTKPKGA